MQEVVGGGDESRTEILRVGCPEGRCLYVGGFRPFDNRTLTESNP